MDVLACPDTAAPFSCAVILRIFSRRCSVGFSYVFFIVSLVRDSANLPSIFDIAADGKADKRPFPAGYRWGFSPYSAGLWSVERSRFFHKCAARLPCSAVMVPRALSILPQQPRGLLRRPVGTFVPSAQAMRSATFARKPAGGVDGRDSHRAKGQAKPGRLEMTDKVRQLRQRIDQEARRIAVEPPPLAADVARREPRSDVLPSGLLLVIALSIAVWAAVIWWWI